jgi:hypothetical protein
MGGSVYDSSSTRHLVETARSSGRSVMGHTARVQAREVEATVHPKLNPKKLNGAT